MVYRNLVKPLFDRLAAGLGLLVIGLPVLVLALFVRLRMGSPVIFRQIRPGKDGKLFGFNKFRSMTQDCDESGNLLPDHLRLTAFGKFLRSTSLDELPQLINVLNGDMSLIGPRPLLPEYLPRYSAFQSRRHEVKPGITGWAQVKGRNTLTWDEKFRLDVWYVDNLSLWLDLKILALTVAAVFGRRGISREGHATMPVFMGNSEGKSA